jgi:hypothetical protein
VLICGFTILLLLLFLKFLPSSQLLVSFYWIQIPAHSSSSSLWLPAAFVPPEPFFPHFQQSRTRTNPIPSLYSIVNSFHHSSTVHTIQSMIPSIRCPPGSQPSPVPQSARAFRSLPASRALHSPTQTTTIIRCGYYLPIPD